MHPPTAESIFDFIFRALNAHQSKDLKIIISQPAMNPEFCRQELIELLFEAYPFVSSVAFMVDALALKPPKEGNALIISIGSSNTHIYPIINSKCDWDRVRRLNWGTAVAVDYFSKLLALKYPGLLTSSSSPYRLTPLQAQALWQKVALIAPEAGAYDRLMSSLADDEQARQETTLAIRLQGDASSEAALRKQVAAAEKAAQVSAAQLQEKRKQLAEKLKARAEEQKRAKLHSKAHIVETLQRLVSRVQELAAKSTIKTKTINKTNEDAEGDISMEFSDDSDGDDPVDDVESGKDIDFTNWPPLKRDQKLAEELIKKFGYKRLSALQAGLRAAEEDLIRAQGGELPAASNVPVDFSLLAVPDQECNESQLKEKRRLRLIKASADARERMKAEKIAAEEAKARADAALEWKRQHELDEWRRQLYGKREELISALIRRQKQRADRKGAAQGSRFRSLMALGPTDDDGNGGEKDASVPEHGPDDGFGMNDDDWLVYRQVSREDEDEADAADSEALAAIEQLLESKDRDEFYRRLEAEQAASVTLLERLSGRTRDQPEDPIPTIYLNVERLRSTEGLFQPASINGIDQAGLVELLEQLFMSLPGEVKAALSSNVIVCGGGSRLPGLLERLQSEMQAILPQGMSVQININSDLEAPWKLMAALEADWITRQQ